MRHQFRLSKSVIGFAALIVASFASPSSAQVRWGSPSVPREGACFYRDTDFRGEAFCVNAGDEFAGLPPGQNDQISSVRVFGNTQVIIFQDSAFRGASARFVADEPDLRREGWNDLISSARVTGGNSNVVWGRDGGNSNVGWGRDRSPQWGRQATPQQGACFYRDTDFRGESFCLNAGDEFAGLPPGQNDQISSVRVFGNSQVTIFRDSSFRGASARFLNDVSDLRNQGWNDLISSARVTSGNVGWGRDRERTPRWERQAAIPQEGACFYRDVDFRGPSFCIPRGGSYELVPGGMNDQISSIRVMGANVVIFTDSDFRGQSRRVSNDVHKLSGGWTDRVSSIRVF